MKETKIIYEMKEKAKIYYSHQIFTHIREKHPNGMISFYNGYIIKVTDDFLLFQDRVIKNPFPILFESIIVIEPNKDPKQKEVKENVEET